MTLHPVSTAELPHRGRGCPAICKAAVAAHTGQQPSTASTPNAECCWPQCGCGHRAAQSVLLLTAHVLAMDPVSWQVVLGELDATLHALIDRTLARPRPRAHQLPPLGRHALTQRAEPAGQRAVLVRTTRRVTIPTWAQRRLRPDRDRAGGLLVRTAMLDVDITARLLSSGLPVFEISDRRGVGDGDPVAARHAASRLLPPLLALETHGRADALVRRARATCRHQRHSGAAECDLPVAGGHRRPATGAGTADGDPRRRHRLRAAALPARRHRQPARRSSADRSCC